LPTLAVPAPGSNAPFLSPDMTGAVTVSKSGYSIEVASSATAGAGPTDCNGTATETGFYAFAEPLDFGVSGDRSFATNHAGTIWAEGAALAPTEPFGAPAVPLR
jgi:hypothetical protein